MTSPRDQNTRLNPGIEAWLRDAGLLHLGSLFARESIDVDVLTDLTDQDLADIGVTLGDRRRFLKARQAYSDAVGSGKKPPVPSPPPDHVKVQETTAERRYMTVMFCDLAGSTHLTEKLDPEEVRRILRDYRDRIAAEVKRFEGHVAQYLGDGVLAYFGWPRAIEHSPARAVTAGLAIAKAVASMESPLGQPLAVRVGIATGLVVVGDFLSGSESEERTAIGDVVNIAARLQNIARPGTVVIAASTLELLGSSFVTADAGTFELKGITNPVSVHEVTGIRDNNVRFEQPEASGSAGEIIGREAELLLVRRRWKQVLDGYGQVIMLSGEPGIGKSRLTADIVRELSEDHCLVIRFFSSPFHLSTALHPFIEHFTHAARIKADDPPVEQLRKLHELVEKTGASIGETVPYLARMMSIAGEGNHAVEEMTPMIRKARTFSALIKLVEAHALKSPVLIVLEDAHWLDPTSSELFELLIQSIPNIPVMLLVNHRPDFRPQWTDAGNLTTLSLQKLRREQVHEIVSRISGGKQLPPRILDMIVERADGVPLFVEELTRAVLELGVLKEVNGVLELASPQTDVIIPHTLRDSLSARLDRHPETREVAQIAACIGREFEFWLLKELTGKNDDELITALEKLQKAELITRWGIPPEASYSFRHGLVRDAAADSILRSRRRQIHERIARTLEQKVPELVAKRFEPLAHHFTQAQCYAEACDYRQKAGNAALAASGNLEAIGEFNSALELINLLPESAARDRQELDILVAQAIAYTLTLGYAAPDVETVYKRAMATCARLDNDAKSFPIVYGFWRFYLLRADFAKARKLSEDLMQIAALSGDDASAVTANRAVGSTSFYIADFETAFRHLERTAGIHPHAELRKTVLSYDVVDPWVVNHAYSGMALWICGFTERAREQNDLAIALARRINHPFTLALALCFATWTYQFEGDRDAVRALAAEALEISRRHNFTFWTGWAEVLFAWSEHKGDNAATRERMRQGLRLWQSTGSLLGLSYFQCLLAQVSEGAEAELLLDAAEKFSLEHDEYFWLPEVHRTRGAFYLSEGYSDAMERAEASFSLALTEARKRNAKSLELRAAVDLAKLWSSHGEAARADSLLAETTAKFGPDHTSPDLEKARAAVLSIAS